MNSAEYVLTTAFNHQFQQNSLCVLQSHSRKPLYYTKVEFYVALMRKQIKILTLTLKLFLVLYKLLGPLIKYQ